MPRYEIDVSAKIRDTVFDQFDIIAESEAEAKDMAKEQMRDRQDYSCDGIYIEGIRERED